MIDINKNKEGNYVIRTSCYSNAGGGIAKFLSSTTEWSTNIDLINSNNSTKSTIEKHKKALLLKLGRTGIKIIVYDFGEYKILDAYETKKMYITLEGQFQKSKCFIANPDLIALANKYNGTKSNMKNKLFLIQKKILEIGCD